jgi:hypothetical protein
MSARPDGLQCFVSGDVPDAVPLLVGLARSAKAGQKTEAMQRQSSDLLVRLLDLSAVPRAVTPTRLPPARACKALPSHKGGDALDFSALLPHFPYSSKATAEPLPVCIDARVGGGIVLSVTGAVPHGSAKAAVGASTSASATLARMSLLPLMAVCSRTSDSGGRGAGGMPGRGDSRRGMPMLHQHSRSRVSSSGGGGAGGPPISAYIDVALPTLVANTCVPVSVPEYYFEVTILSMCSKPGIRIGLLSEAAFGLGRAAKSDASGGARRQDDGPRFGSSRYGRREPMQRQATRKSHRYPPWASGCFALHTTGATLSYTPAAAPAAAAGGGGGGGGGGAISSAAGGLSSAARPSTAAPGSLLAFDAAPGSAPGSAGLVAPRVLERQTSSVVEDDEPFGGGDGGDDGGDGDGGGEADDSGGPVMERKVDAQYTTPINVNEVIGVGWNLLDSTVYFTRNGVLLDVAFTGVEAQRLLPAVSLGSSGDCVELNFGQSPFRFTPRVLEVDEASVKQRLERAEKLKREQEAAAKAARLAQENERKQIAGVGV